MLAQTHMGVCEGAYKHVLLITHTTLSLFICRLSQHYAAFITIATLDVCFLIANYLLLFLLIERFQSSVSMYFSLLSFFSYLLNSFISHVKIKKIKMI